MSDQLNNTGQQGTSDAPYPADFRSGTPQPSTVPEVSGVGHVEPGTDPMAPQRRYEQPESEMAPQAPQHDEVSPEAKLQRLQQSLAQKNKLLSAVGIDPTSDLGEQLESGLVTEEMIARHIAAQRGQTSPDVPQRAQSQPTFVDTAKQRLDAARQAYDQQVQSGEGVDFNVNKELIDAQTEYFDAQLNTVTQQVTAREQQRQVSENVNSVLSVARSDPSFSSLDDNSKQVYENMLCHMTGSLADQEAARLGMSPMEFSPQQFAGLAQKAIQQLNPIAQHYMEMGRREAQQSLAPRHPQFNNAPPPVNNAGPSIPVQDPYAKADYRNHNDMARAYLNRTGQVI